MSYLRCVRVSPENVIVNGDSDNPVWGLQYQLIEVDDKGVCVNAEDGSKDFTKVSDIETVSKGICAQLIAQGMCPMVDWGIRI